MRLRSSKCDFLRKLHRVQTTTFDSYPKSMCVVVAKHIRKFIFPLRCLTRCAALRYTNSPETGKCVYTHGARRPTCSALPQNSLCTHMCIHIPYTKHITHPHHTRFRVCERPLRYAADDDVNDAISVVVRWIHSTLALASSSSYL